MNYTMIFSKRHFLVIAMSMILFGVISDVGASQGKVQAPTKWSLSRLWDKVMGKPDEAQSSATCLDCWNGASYSLPQKENFHNIAIFLKNDPRTIVPPDGNPRLNAIGIVEVRATLEKPPREAQEVQSRVDFVAGKEWQTEGSGFMINECIVLTNHHTAFVHSDQKDVSNQKITFRFKDRDTEGVFSKKARVVTGRVIDDHESYLGEKDDGGKDWTFVKLDQPRRDKKGIIPICHLDKDDAKRASATSNISSASYYADLAPNGENLWEQKKCKILGIADNQPGAWRTDCPSLPGACGSPILKKDEKTGEVCALGFITGTTAKQNYSNAKDNINEYNTMIPFSGAFSKSRLEKIIKDNPCGKTTIM